MVVSAKTQHRTRGSLSDLFTASLATLGLHYGFDHGNWGMGAGLLIIAVSILFVAMWTASDRSEGDR